MCKNITNVRVIWVFDYFLCSSYRYIIYTHSRSNLCHNNVSSTYYVSKKYLHNLTFNIPKIDFSNPAKLSGSGGIFAGAGFLPDLEKCRIPAGAGAEIQYSPSFKYLVNQRNNWHSVLLFIYLLTRASELPWKHCYKQCGCHWLVSCVCFGEPDLKWRIEVRVYLQSILFEYCWSFTRVWCVKKIVRLTEMMLAFCLSFLPLMWRQYLCLMLWNWALIEAQFETFEYLWSCLWSFGLDLCLKLKPVVTQIWIFVWSSEPCVVLVQDVKRSIIDESLQTLVDYVVKPSATDNTAQRWTTTVFRNASSVLRWVPACMCRHACMWLPCSMLLTVTRHLLSPQSSLLMTDVTYCGVHYFHHNSSDRWCHESSCKPNRLARSVDAY